MTCTLGAQACAKCRRAGLESVQTRWSCRPGSGVCGVSEGGRRLRVGACPWRTWAHVEGAGRGGAPIVWWHRPVRNHGRDASVSPGACNRSSRSRRPKRLVSPSPGGWRSGPGGPFLLQSADFSLSPSGWREKEAALSDADWPRVPSRAPPS